MEERRITSLEIENMIRDGENIKVEFKSALVPSVINSVVSFANTDGGYIIVGYDERKGVIGVNISEAKRARSLLKEYANIVDLYDVQYAEKNLLVISVKKSDSLVENKEVIYYRQKNGQINSIETKESEKITNIILNSVKDLTLSDISKEAEIGKNILRNWLAHNVSEGSLFSRKLGNAYYYSYKPDDSQDNKSQVPFEDIHKGEELIAYLQKRVKDLDGKQMLHQYTSIKAATAILSKGELFIGSPQNMNDINEYKNFCVNGDDSAWEGVFCSCFMEEDTESIAMWSQYAQPWEEGVRLSISVEKLKKWFKSLSEVYVADAEKNKIESQKVKNSKFQKLIYKVAYTNTEDVLRDGGKEIVFVGIKENNRFHNIYDNKELCGYIKNNAWNYEKEIRLRIDIPGEIGKDKDKRINGIIIPIPEEVLSGFTLMKGPRVSTDDTEWKTLLSIAQKKGIVSHSNSIFEGKLQKLACDNCSYRNKNNNG